jgi:cytochrome b pre-mRNA-processing protein 3
MFAFLKRQQKSAEIQDIYHTILKDARDPKLYEDYHVPDTPIGRFQMIALHSAPYFAQWARTNETRKSQALFDMIFRDIELSFREIGVGDLAVPKKMKAWMKDFNGIIQAHAASNADHVEITRRNVFDEDFKMSNNFKKYIQNLFAELKNG